MRRRRWLVPVAAALVVAVAGVTVWSLAGGDDGDEDRLTVATELADRWDKGFEENDPDLVMSIFTRSGIFIDEDGQTFVGEEIRGQVEILAPVITEGDRVEGLEMVEAGVYAWATEFDVAGFGRRRAVFEMELEGDLATRVETLQYGSAG